MREKLVIVGGNAAGMSAASQARRVDPSAEITVFEQGRFISYSSCALPFLISREVGDSEALVVHTPDWFREKRNIAVSLRHQVTDIFPARHSIQVRDLDTGKLLTCPYTRLIIAAGARPVIPFPVAPDVKNVFTLRSIPDGTAIGDILDSRQPSKCVIIGAGALGVELAETFVKRGIHTTIIERGDRILNEFEPEIAGTMLDILTTHGIQVSLNSEVEKIIGSGTGSGQVWCRGDDSREFDICVVTAGVRPENQLAARAGLDLNRYGAVAVNDRLETSVRHIYAAGDCAATWNLVLRQSEYCPLGTTANQQGHVAGENAAGGSKQYRGSAETQVLRVFGHDLARSGLTETRALRNGLAPITTVITSRDVPRYFRDSKPVTLKMCAEKLTGRLLGVSLIGPEGTAKRIDAAATALFARLTVLDLTALDYGYSPPISTAHDPMLIAARDLAAKLI